MLDVIIWFLISQSVVLAVGVAALLSLDAWRLPGPLFASSAWLAGNVVLAAERLLLAQARLPWNAATLGLPAILMALVAVYRLRNTVRNVGKYEGKFGALKRFLQDKGWRYNAAIMSVVVILCAVLLVRTSQERVRGYDAMVIWIFKARVFYHEGTVPDSFLRNPVFTTSIHTDYPPLVPLSVAHIYSFTGDNEAIAKGWWVLLAGAAAVGLYWGLEGLVGQAARISGLILLLLLPEILVYTTGGLAGYADLPLAVFLLYSGIFCFRWLNRPSRANFVLAVLSLCGAGFTKNEGLVVSVAGLVLLWLMALLRQRSVLDWGLVSAALVLLILVPWQVQIRLLGLQHDLQPSLQVILANFPSRIFPILGRLFVKMTDISQVGWTWIGLPFAALASLVVAPRRWLPSLAVLGLILIHMTSITIAYLVTPYDLKWHMSTSADRLVLQITPLGLLLITVSLGRLIDGNRSGRQHDQLTARLPGTHSLVASSHLQA